MAEAQESVFLYRQCLAAREEKVDPPQLWYILVHLILRHSEHGVFYVPSNLFSVKSLLEVLGWSESAKEVTADNGISCSLLDDFISPTDPPSSITSTNTYRAC